METSGEIGEKSSCDYRCDSSDGFSNHNLIIVAHEDCAVQAGVI